VVKRIGGDDQVRRPRSPSELKAAATLRPKVALPKGGGVKGDGMTREKPKLPGLGDGGQAVTPDQAFSRSELEKQAAASKANSAWFDQVNAAFFADPRIKATYEGLKALGYTKFAPNVGELVEVFSTTDLEPEDLLKHYAILIGNRGGDENRVAAGGHGAEFRNLAQGLGPRLQAGLYGKPGWSTDADAANPVQASARPASQFKGVPFDPLGKAGVAATGPKTFSAQQAKWDRSFGKAKSITG